jgi:thymidylate synthase (FAD)
MAETTMTVKLLAHTQLSESFTDHFYEEYMSGQFTDGQAVALTAIRTCYSPLKPSEIVSAEGEKYFANKATDGEGGTEADRLFRHIVSSKHLSTLEHISYTFAIESVSRALLAQLTRHRVGFSFSVQSQRYVRMGSGDKSGGFDYVMPPSVNRSEDMVPYGDTFPFEIGAIDIYIRAMEKAQAAYDMLRQAGMPAEDARMVLPNSASTNLVMTANLRALLEFYSKRKPGKGAQWEIANLAEALRNLVVNVDPWADAYFEGV